MAFAPGKVILLGEHAVVYGQPALAGALDAGVEVVVRGPGEGRLHVPALGVSVVAGAADDSLPPASARLAAAYGAIRSVVEKVAGYRTPEVDFEARFQLPTGSGLGSSAALSVAIARALGTAAGVTFDDGVLGEAAMASENVFHGRASGIDHAVSIAGGFGLFTRAGGLAPIPVAASVPLVIGHTGRERDTRGRVSRVAEIVAERPDEARARFDAIGALVRRGAAAVGEGRLDVLGAVMNENQQHLEVLEVSCPEIERLCEVARDAGAIGAKLTGGGGGGCVIALAPGREEAVVRAWARAGFERFPSLVVHVGGAPRSVSVGKGQFGIETAGGEASGGTAAGISRGVAGGVAGGVK